MKKKDQKAPDEDTMRDHYDFDYSKADWGRTAKRLAKEGYPVMVMLDPDVSEVFRDTPAVNEALRGLIELSKKAGAAKNRRKRRPAARAARAVKG